MIRFRRVFSSVLMVFAISVTAQAVRAYQENHMATKLRTLAGNGFTPALATKTNNCIITDYLPDRECTPGAIFPKATREMICTKGYARSVRNVSQSTKEAAYNMYGITEHPTGAYEVDHFISLELGGSNDIANLWPEAATGEMNSHEKDVVENFLHDELCAGRLSVSEVQELVSWKWKEAYAIIR